MIVATDYPFLDVVWTTIVLVALVLFLWLVIAVLTDTFRRDEIGGVKKVAWAVFVVFVPVVGVFAYLIANGDGMAARSAAHGRTLHARPAVDVDFAAPSAATEIERAKRLLDDGAITQAEFEAIKARTLA